MYLISFLILINTILEIIFRYMFLTQNSTEKKQTIVRKLKINCYKEMQICDEELRKLIIYTFVRLDCIENSLICYSF